MKLTEMVTLVQQNNLNYYMDSNDKVLLVSAVYSCEKRHKILAHDKVGKATSKSPHSILFTT